MSKTNMDPNKAVSCWEQNFELNMHVTVASNRAKRCAVDFTVDLKSGVVLAWFCRQTTQTSPPVLLIVAQGVSNSLTKPANIIQNYM